MASVGRIAETIPMTYARSQIAPPGEFGCLHVVTQYVRRAFLCGSDERTGKDFDHRAIEWGSKVPMTSQSALACSLNAWMSWSS